MGVYKWSKWNDIPPQKIKWNKHYESLVKRIEDKSIRQFRKNLLTENFRTINLTASILSGLSPTNNVHGTYRERLNRAVKSLKQQEKYLLSLKP